MKINLTQPSPQGEGSPLLLEEKGPGVEVLFPEGAVG